MEIRMQEVILMGRMVGNPIVREEGTYFRFQADRDQAPFHCVCDGKTAENLVRFCQDGDEFSLEGKLQWREFKSGKVLMIYARYISYGRKLRTLRKSAGDL